MDVSVSKDTRQISITFDDQEWSIIHWVLANYGPNIIQDLMQMFIDSRTAQKRDTEMGEFHNAFMDLSEEDKNKVLDLLGLKLNQDKS